MGGTLGLIAAGDTAAAPDAVAPQWAPYARYGARLGESGWAGSVSLSLAGSDAASDVYVQLPARDSLWVYGGGVIGASRYTMPYAQLGRSLGRGYEVYTTQGYVRWNDFTDKREGMYGVNSQVRPRYWTPAVALRRHEGVGGATIEVAGAVGSFEERVDESSASIRRPLRAVTVRVAAELDVGYTLRALGRLSRQPIPRLR